MKIKTTIKVEYSNGRFRKLSLLETDPHVAEHEVDGEITKRRPATIEDFKVILRKSLATFMRENKIRTFIDYDTNKVVVIRFSEVVDIELDIQEVEENDM